MNSILFNYLYQEKWPPNENSSHWFEHTCHCSSKMISPYFKPKRFRLWLELILLFHLICDEIPFSQMLIVTTSKQCTTIFDSWQWTWCTLTNAWKSTLSIRLQHRCHLTKWTSIYCLTVRAMHITNLFEFVTWRTHLLFQILFWYMLYSISSFLFLSIQDEHE